MLPVGDKITPNNLDRILCEADYRYRIKTRVYQAPEDALFLDIVPYKEKCDSGTAKRKHFCTPFDQLPAARMYYLSS
jgi:hypothetical protein